MEEILHRMPDMEYAEVRQLVNGPESFTHDMEPLVGEAAEVRIYSRVNSYCRGMH